jgi:transcriptional regulator with PAS, ATPase and Fis domain
VNLKHLGENIARHESVTVLITGESGTGKELFAQAIHHGSVRTSFPFVRVNCASIPSTLLEAELFGYEEGAYTGARKGGKQGKLELAHNGTVFLDEIGELPLSMQSKLLIFLQEREIERLGSNRPVKVNVRIIAATNRNLEKMIKQENFREDLYYRLNVARIEIPPLRHRKSDIPLLSKHYVSKISERHDMQIDRISKEAVDLLLQYKWPGNIRELENVLERSLILANLEQETILLPRHIVLPIHNIGDDLADDITMSTNIKDLKTLVNQYEKMVISQILRETNNDKIQSAKFLGINLSSLYRKAKKYGIDDN